MGRIGGPLVVKAAAAAAAAAYFYRGVRLEVRESLLCEALPAGILRFSKSVFFVRFCTRSASLLLSGRSMQNSVKNAP